MPRKPPKYKQLGLTKTKNGYLKENGEYISNRQYKKLVGTPIKGSPGYKERKEAKERGEDLRPEYTPKRSPRVKEPLKTFAKKRGATSDWFRTGKERDIPISDTKVQETHFKAINKQRRDAIYFKEKAGVITPKQAEKLREEFREEHYQRGKMAKLYEQLNNWNSERPGGRMFTNAERARKEREYQRARHAYDKARQKLEKFNILPDKHSNLYEGYYHQKK